MGFIALDFETSCNSMDSACSIGIVRVQDKEIVDTRHYYIQPPSLDFDWINVKIHGITPDIVQNQPKFPDIWNEIHDLFYENIIIAHNASFDMSILRALQTEYDLHIPNFLYACSMEVSQLICHECGGSLTERAAYLGINPGNHHNALDDAITSAKLVLSTMDHINANCIGSLLAQYPFISTNNFYDIKVPGKSVPRKKPGYGNSNIHVRTTSIQADVSKIDVNHPFYGKQIVVTGEFEKLPRKDAFQKIADIGGILKSGVSRNTHILIVGKQDNSIVGDDGMSTKEEKAYDLISQGHYIEIIKENEFYEILGI